MQASVAATICSDAFFHRSLGRFCALSFSSFPSQTMATIRKWLADAGFDFDAGTIVYQKTAYSRAPGWDDPEEAMVMSPSILDLEFDDSFGAPYCPRFFARCGDFVYFPSQYDGSTDLCKVNVEPSFYLDTANPTPYPGGG
jgi:hypothetical protein